MKKEKGGRQGRLPFEESRGTPTSVPLSFGPMLLQLQQEGFLGEWSPAQVTRRRRRRENLTMTRARNRSKFLGPGGPLSLSSNGNRPWGVFFFLKDISKDKPCGAGQEPPESNLNLVTSSSSRPGKMAAANFRPRVFSKSTAANLGGTLFFQWRIRIGRGKFAPAAFLQKRPVNSLRAGWRKK